MIRAFSRFGAAVGFGLTFFAASAGAQVRTQSGGEVAPASCVATVSSDSTSAIAGAASVVVRAALSAELGDSVTATFPQDSKITVVKVAPGANKQAREVEVTLNASEAKAGSYPISLKGKTAACTGTLKIGPGK
jgi:hypothetical protein